MLNIAFPAVVANALLRKMFRDAAPKASAQAAPAALLRELLLECEFPLRLEIPHASVSLRQLVRMAEGTILTFEHPVRDDIFLSVDNVKLYRARPVRTERNRGARLHSRLQVPAGESVHA